MELFLDALQLVAQGKLHPEVAEALSASTLVPIGKEGDGFTQQSGKLDIRPIAIGEVIMRVVNKAITHQKKSAFSRFFTPCQYGVMASCGAEQLIHTITAHLSLFTTHVVVGLDCSNAFNSLMRAACFRALADAPPDIRDMLPLAAQFYLTNGMLHVYSAPGVAPTTLFSTSGVRQGDPLGSFLFAVGIDKILKAVNDEFKSQGVMVLAYLDDIFIVGPSTAVRSAVSSTLKRLAAINLFTNVDKCWAFSPSGDYGDILNPFSEPSVAGPSDAFSINGFTLKQRDCPKILGCFIGAGASERLRHRYVTNAGSAKSVTRKATVLTGFARSGREQLALQLTTCCAAPTVNFALRAGRPGDTAAMALATDEIIKEAISNICGVELDALKQELPGSVIRLPQRMGGMGIQSAVSLHKTAYLASWVAAAPLIGLRWPHLAEHIALLDGAEPPSGFGEEIDAQRKYCTDELGLGDLLDTFSFHPQVADPNGGPATKKLAGVQQKFADAEAERTMNNITNAVNKSCDKNEPYSKELKAWAMSLSADGRSAFLHVTPKIWINLLTGRALEFAIRRLLRLPLRGFDGLLCACKQTLDPFGDHADVCGCQIGQRTQRHHHVAHHALVPPARQAKLLPSPEATGLVEDSNGRPADIAIENGHQWGPGVTACYDLVACSTSAKARVDDAGRHPGGAMNYNVARKLLNAKRLKGAGKELMVIPMAFDTQGGLHSNWRTTFVSWAERWRSHGEDRTEAMAGALVRSWLAIASMEVQRAQFALTERMRAGAEDRLHGGLPHAWRPLGADDFGPHLVACPPLGA